MINFVGIKEELKLMGVVDWIEENEMVIFDDLVYFNKVGKINKKFGINDLDVEKLWSFEVMEMDKLYNYIEINNIKFKKKVLIVIFDMGVDFKYEDLVGNYKFFRGKYDDDLCGYGIYCVGIVVVVFNNGIGVVFYFRDNCFV